MFICSFFRPRHLNIFIKPKAILLSRIDTSVIIDHSPPPSLSPEVSRWNVVILSLHLSPSSHQLIHHPKHQNLHSTI